MMESFSIPDDERAGTQQNYRRLLKYLKPYECCRNPMNCGSACMQSELSYTLANAYSRIMDEFSLLVEKESKQ